MMNHEMHNHEEMMDRSGDMHDMSHMTHGGHEMGHMHHMDFKKKFFICLFLTIPILLFSPMMGMTLPFTIHFPGSVWVVAILGTIIYLYGGKPFMDGAKDELHDRKPAMMTLVTMGITVAFFYSIYSVVANDVFHVVPKVDDFFWELATLIDIMLLGHWIEMKTVMQAGQAVEKLAKLLPDTAHVLHGEHQMDMPIATLKKDMIVLVKASEKIPADGVIIEGKTSVNESMITGESKLVAKAIEDTVIGGSTNGDGLIKVRVTGTGETGYLAKVGRLIQEAQQSKTQEESLADKVAGLLFYAALIIAILAFVIWTIVSGVSVAFPIAVTVLVIACPHALGLAIPLVSARTTALAATNGLLIRNREVMQTSTHLSYVLMDKTGTLTEGKFTIQTIESLNKMISKEEVLQLAATLEQGTNHPLALGILEAAKEQKISLLQAENTEQLPGMGILGTIHQQKVAFVSKNYLVDQKIPFDKEKFDELASSGVSVSYLVIDGKAVGLITQGDQIKEDAKAFIVELKKRNLTPVMVTGDNEHSAKKVADLLAIGEVRAEVRPEEKAAIVAEYCKLGRVMMIGDGVNDAPALALSDIGVAIGAGTDIAIDSADVVLVKSRPIDVITFLKLSKQSVRKMKQNLFWGAGYNVLALPLAAGVLAPIGFLLNPMIGAVLMSLSTVIVAVNAMLLRIE
ncbi:MAG: copper-translocating P-type ATPase [Lactobacillales bacterium]|nr:copper-translocating P-type ATPase [Lactobacillales bacterium]